MEERIIIPRRREPRDQAADAGDAAATAVSCSWGEESTDGDSEPDFEFEFPALLGRGHGSPAPADDLFADGRIRPAAFYPVFGRRANSAGDVDAPAPERRTRGQLGRLFLEESREWNSASSSSTGSTASTSSSSSSAATADDGDGDGGLEGAAPDSYCVWAPGGGGKTSESPRPPRAGKSGSTGSSVARWRRISDLVVGRSQSDGKEKFLFFPVNPPTPPKQQEPKPKPRPRPPNPAAGGTKKKGSEIGTVAAAHRMAYGGKAGAGIAANGATPRRTFLPYREELVGFFANVNGISRSHAHPY